MVMLRRSVCDLRPLDRQYSESHWKDGMVPRQCHTTTEITTAIMNGGGKLATRLLLWSIVLSPPFNMFFHRTGRPNRRLLALADPYYFRETVVVLIALASIQLQAYSHVWTAT